MIETKISLCQAEYTEIWALVLPRRSPIRLLRHRGNQRVFAIQVGNDLTPSLSWTEVADRIGQSVMDVMNVRN